MKKFALPMGVLAIIIAGALFFINQKEKVAPTADNEIVVSDTQTEDAKVSEVSKETEKTHEKSAKVDSDEVSEKKELNNEKVIINPITEETHPVGFYDKVLEDGYTYNNPAPIPEDWIIEPATDEYPATLDYEKMRATVSESYLLPGRISTMFSMVPEHMHGYTPRILFLRNKNGFTNKAEFLDWLRQYTDSDIYFVSESKYNNRGGGKNWNIFIKEGSVDSIFDSYSKLKTDSMVSMRAWNQYLPQYRGTKELQDAIDATNRAITE